jgi:hypothetical protein
VTLNVETKSILAVLGVIEILLMENHLRTVDLGYFMLRWKEVELFGTLHD